MTLFLFMLERVGLIIIFAFLVSRLKPFRTVLQTRKSWSSRAVLIVIFGLLGIVSSYTGIRIENGAIYNEGLHATLNESDAIANTRVISTAIAGLFGGPIVGLGAGVIAGGHRLMLGGFSAVACGISTILAGLIAGLLGRKYRIHRTFSYSHVLWIGISVELLQMALILLIAKPFEEAWALVQVIALPMIFMNAFGLFMFCLIIKMAVLEEERTKADQIHDALQIAQLTLEHFRQGLNEKSCKKVAEILRERTGVAAVAITDRNGILTHVGVGDDHHVPRRDILTELTKKVLAQGRILIAYRQQDIQCPHRDCLLQAAIVLPLNVHQKTVGTLKLYFTDPSHLTTVEEEFAEGLSRLFSSQLEYAEIEQQRKLLKDAEIKALQAQVHPHFFFNSLNAISSLIRTNPVEARKLLLKLSTFFRSNMQGASQTTIPLQKELEHVEAYMAIEQARFPTKYKTVYEIDEQLLHVLVPPFTLQPLIENAIYHAFKDRKSGHITVRAVREEHHVLLQVIDDGIGIDEGRVQLLGREIVHSDTGTGSALWNIESRIKELYSGDGFIKIVTNNYGTAITIRIPIVEEVAT